MIFLWKPCECRYSFIRSRIHYCHSVYTAALFTRDVSRDRAVVLLVSSFIPPFFLSISSVLRGTIGGEDTRRASRCKSSFRNPTEVVFSFRLPRRKWESPRTIRECLICGYNGLLYEILILEDIQQAYIWLACKSSPYLISRGCEIWWLRGMMARFMLQSFLYFFLFFQFFLHRLIFVKSGLHHSKYFFNLFYKWIHCDFNDRYFIKSYWVV